MPHLRLSGILLFFSLALWSCGGRAPARTPDILQQSTPTSPSVATLTPSPSPTPPTNLVILLAPSGADASLVSRLQGLLSSLIAGSDLRLQTRPALVPQEMPQARIVVALPPVENLSDLASSYPQTSFLAVFIPALQPARNLSVIEPPAERPDQIGFLAGFTAAAISPDWRTGVLTTASPRGNAIRQGFINGVYYFCGLCRPVYPPFPATGYPITIQLDAGSSPSDWQAAATMLASWEVSTAFVAPDLSDERLLTILAEAGINLILPDAPPSALQEHWVASLGYSDPLLSIQTLWPGLLQAQSGVSLQTALDFTAVNPSLLSPGRQRMAQEMLKDLLAGYIDTGVDPAVWEGQ